MDFNSVVIKVPKILALTFLVAISSSGNAVFAHEGGHHGMHHDDPAMAKLHKIMPMYAREQALLNEALTKKDAVAVKTETDKILETIPDLKESKPHKNVKDLAAFRRAAAAFDRDVRKTAQLAKAGDFVGARRAFDQAQKSCNDCHKKFRD